ncbi:MAG TPA: ATP-dependent RNA helicase [Marinilabiliales bacterium]|nr:DEAD/DEAH box helicase [Salinivirgaceae bacterium]OFX46754.1 MAG: ATP-dependent RNA helicase [Bacteroidetes bacterium GWA2_40_14]OFX56902.1 MAG: ATP-dependent RNA helicase [Bacteroidetes bacterium GWC2_40_13]OFX76183.1 MAG: ATP-dependent RNA helicase [Bacteroidetes bacterium GWD2_40_43]OFX95368.1 MAG: ATP-dependent RNA helicase [Bacteroidetes bacterium GWE2_40_63]OFY19031.1 MAG: ATP-dependent RNA helicase [Bacteroidetes bacterium GWF2_40_13]OFZ23987.1 MAG: ATP-dependent RNA helicase [Bacte
MKFSEFKLHQQVFEGVEAMGFEEPSPVQEKVIPIALEGKDFIACAQTGTGKTAAYLLPLMHHLINRRSNKIKGLILAPTRELVMQIDQQFQGFAYFTGLESIAIYGGSDSSIWDQQRVAIERGCNMLIASPGRLLSHLNLGYVDLSELEYLILDEADKMLDMGFVDDINKIVTYLPSKRQTMMFSATMPSKIRVLANFLLKNPVEINIAVSKPAEGVLQAAYMTFDNQKNRLISHLLANKELDSVIIFSSTKIKVKQLHAELVKAGFAAKAIHSDLEQAEREVVMRDFRNRKFPILVATDIVSRGIDVDNIGLVINYDVPHDAEDYVHRIGRTARASSTGVGLTFINEVDIPRFARIEKLIETTIFKIPNPPEIGEGPSYDIHLMRKNNRNHSHQKKGKFNNRRRQPRVQ